MEFRPYYMAKEWVKEGHDVTVITAAFSHLRQKNIEIKERKEEFIDGITIADMLNEPYERVFKTLVTEGKGGGYFVFVIPIDQELDLKKAAKAAGEKSVEMIHVKDINKITGYIRGGCTAIGMKKDYPTVLDESANAQEKIIVSGGKNGIQIELTTEDYLKACKGKTADITLR